MLLVLKKLPSPCFTRCMCFKTFLVSCAGQSMLIFSPILRIHLVPNLRLFRNCTVLSCIRVLLKASGWNCIQIVILWHLKGSWLWLPYPSEQIFRGNFSFVSVQVCNLVYNAAGDSFKLIKHKMLVWIPNESVIYLRSVANERLLDEPLLNGLHQVKPLLSSPGLFYFIPFTSSFM